jgi:predicted HicB family RNase H-like nuclease
MVNEVKLTLRLPAELHESLVALAAKYVMSLNGEMVARLWDSVEAEAQED